MLCHASGNESSNCSPPLEGHVMVLEVIVSQSNSGLQQPVFQMTGTSFPRNYLVQETVFHRALNYLQFHDSTLSLFLSNVNVFRGIFFNNFLSVGLSRKVVFVVIQQPLKHLNKHSTELFRPGMIKILN